MAMALRTQSWSRARRLQVEERGRQAGADAVGRFGQVGGDGQILLQPQVLHVGVELLADIHLTGLQRSGAGGVVLEDRVRQILRRRQLAPHAGVLAPVVVIAHVDNLGVVGEELVIRAGIDNVLSGDRPSTRWRRHRRALQASRSRPSGSRSWCSRTRRRAADSPPCHSASSLALMTTVCGSTASMVSIYSTFPAPVGVLYLTWVAHV
jgi:hypothetical protein